MKKTEKMALVGNNDTMDDWWVVASGGCILKIGLRAVLMVLFCDFNRRANETKC